MFNLDLCWDENGRNVVIRQGCPSSAAEWPFTLFHLGTAKVEARALSRELRAQLELFGSAPLDAANERAIVSRLVTDPPRLAA